MITGAHILLYSRDPEADRVFFRDVLGFRYVDVGGGWLIFAMPATELAVHPGDGSFVQTHADERLSGAVMYLMCDDLAGAMRMLGAKKVVCAAPVEAEWGRATSVALPGGGRIGLYQPRHARPS